MGRGRKPHAAVQPQPRTHHVRRNRHGGWDVTTADGVECSHHETDIQAVAWMRGVLRETGGGLIVVHGRHERVVRVDAG
jgi:uncharacterized protein DUF2188